MAMPLIADTVNIDTYNEVAGNVVYSTHLHFNFVEMMKIRYNGISLERTDSNIPKYLGPASNSGFFLVLAGLPTPSLNPHPSEKLAIHFSVR